MVTAGGFEPPAKGSIFSATGLAALPDRRISRGGLPRELADLLVPLDQIAAATKVTVTEHEMRRALGLDAAFGNKVDRIAEADMGVPQSPQSRRGAPARCCEMKLACPTP